MQAFVAKARAVLASVTAYVVANPKKGSLAAFALGLVVGVLFL